MHVGVARTWPLTHFFVCSNCHLVELPLDRVLGFLLAAGGQGFVGRLQQKLNASQLVHRECPRHLKCWSTKSVHQSKKRGLISSAHPPPWASHELGACVREMRTRTTWPCLHQSAARQPCPRSKWLHLKIG